MNDQENLDPSWSTDEMERALLNAVHAARTAYESATAEHRPQGRQAYSGALKALNAHICDS